MIIKLHFIEHFMQKIRTFYNNFVKKKEKWTCITTRPLLLSLLPNLAEKRHLAQPEQLEPIIANDAGTILFFVQCNNSIPLIVELLKNPEKRRIGFCTSVCELLL